MQGLVEAGGVVVAAATRRLLGDRFRLRDLGKHAVKGLAEPVEAWAALGVSESESRFEAHGWRCPAERKLRLGVRQYGERYLWFESVSLRQ